MHQITVNDLVVDVHRKDIKNLHLGVYPPEGRVRVAAPLNIDDEAVRLFVISKLGWIKKQQREFLAQPRQSKREYISGESHYFLGDRYLLNVVYRKGHPKVSIRNKTYLDLFVREGSDLAYRKRVMTEWYRSELKALAAPLVEKWKTEMDVPLTHWGIRSMKTKWGSCNIEKGRILLNLELAKKPQHCVEYIIVHELVHLLGRHHNDRFVALMDQYMPQWRLYRDELNAYPLKHEKWEY
ncbi:MAG: SprT family zinc-dependent metalloprotease [Chloroflexota bacterium]|nr:SprT family zinc-dependent metalloprotease [Chloroflexota bacterium]